MTQNKRFKKVYGVVLGILTILIVITMTGCGSSGSSGGSSSTSKTFSQTQIDSDTVWGIGWLIMDIYNQHLAGKPSGSQNYQSVSCPLGGTVTITGTTSVSSSNGINSVDLYYTMSNCSDSKIGSNTIALTVTGTIEETGSFGGTTNKGYEDLSFRSIGYLTIVGTDTNPQYTTAVINEQCAYAETIYTADGTSGTTSGTICGRNVGWKW
ncbi:MAG: hypothetical protein ACP5MB_01665 [bacterium]